jgi:hypothetical protein
MIAEAFGVREDTGRLWSSAFINGGIYALKADLASGHIHVAEHLQSNADGIQQPDQSIGQREMSICIFPQRGAGSALQGRSNNSEDKGDDTAARCYACVIPEIPQMISLAADEQKPLTYFPYRPADAPASLPNTAPDASPAPPR